MTTLVNLQNLNSTLRNDKTLRICVHSQPNALEHSTGQWNVRFSDWKDGWEPASWTRSGLGPDIQG